MENQFYKTSTLDNLTMERKTGYNSTFAIGGISYFADSFVVNQSLVLRISICGENRHLRQARNRCEAILPCGVKVSRNYTSRSRFSFFA